MHVRLSKTGMRKSRTSAGDHNWTYIDICNICNNIISMLKKRVKMHATHEQVNQMHYVMHIHTRRFELFICIMPAEVIKSRKTQHYVNEHDDDDCPNCIMCVLCTLSLTLNRNDGTRRCHHLVLRMLTPQAAQ